MKEILAPLMVLVAGEGATTGKSACGEVCVMAQNLQLVTAMPAERREKLKNPVLENLPFDKYYESYVNCHFSIFGNDPFPEGVSDADIDKKFQTAFDSCANDRISGDKRYIENSRSAGTTWESKEDEALGIGMMRAFYVVWAVRRTYGSRQFDQYLSRRLPDPGQSDAPNS